jgi:hypothetical protein
MSCLIVTIAMQGQFHLYDGISAGTGNHNGLGCSTGVEKRWATTPMFLQASIHCPSSRSTLIQYTW